MSHYLVWNPEGGTPTVSHETFDSAVNEAKRLARLNPGKRFHVMGIAGTALVQEPNIYHSSGNFDGLPF